jgi:hypothetical protein
MEESSTLHNVVTTPAARTLPSKTKLLEGSTFPATLVKIPTCGESAATTNTFTWAIEEPTVSDTVTARTKEEFATVESVEVTVSNWAFELRTKPRKQLDENRGCTVWQVHSNPKPTFPRLAWSSSKLLDALRSKLPDSLRDCTEPPVSNACTDPFGTETRTMTDEAKDGSARLLTVNTMLYFDPTCRLNGGKRNFDKSFEVDFKPIEEIVPFSRTFQK